MRKHLANEAFVTQFFFSPHFLFSPLISRKKKKQRRSAQAPRERGVRYAIFPISRAFQPRLTLPPPPLCVCAGACPCRACAFFSSPDRVEENEGRKISVRQRCSLTIECVL